MSGLMADYRIMNRLDFINHDKIFPLVTDCGQEGVTRALKFHHTE